ncbi:unnamed protein product [marine sediment metagenome]|uniref:Uncharacterized protein n=1 Tax=marine sediment metagenome TaxID=412755 RepID=X1SRG9_9ZZZZ
MERRTVKDVKKGKGIKKYAQKERKLLFLFTFCPKAFAPDRRGLCTYNASKDERGFSYSQDLP